MSCNNRIKSKAFDNRNQFCQGNISHSFVSTYDLWDEIKQLKNEIERKNKIISVYEIDIHKLQQSLQNQSNKILLLKRNMTIYQNIHNQLNNLKQSINGVKSFVINEITVIQNHYNNIIHVILSKTKELEQRKNEQLMEQYTLKEQTRQQNQKLFYNQEQFKSKVNKYEKKEFKIENDSSLLTCYSNDKVKELEEIIKEKEMTICQLKHSLKESVMSLSSGLETVKIAMKLDDEVKQLLSKSKI